MSLPLPGESLSVKIADVIIWMYGRNSAAYPSSSGKWAVVMADTIDLLVPVLIIVAAIGPLFFVWKKYKKFTLKNVIIAAVIGGVLAYSIHWLNEWSYGYGQTVIFNQIYE